jgi:2-iminobutanoate/2-iminopropanoate deaminase
MKKQIATPAAPAAIGPYSQAIGDGEWVFCSGQIGIDPKSGRLVEGGTEHEMRRVMENLREVLSAAGLDFGDIVKTTIYVADLGAPARRPSRDRRDCAQALVERPPAARRATAEVTRRRGSTGCSVRARGFCAPPGAAVSGL